jgi:shikimate kinase
MRQEVRLALTGFMGVGKTSVARHLEHMTGCRRIDLDSMIEDRAGKTIAEIIASEGIPRFREFESEALSRVIEANRGCILSLGGGTWTIAANRDLIKQSGFTSVWLESTFEHCWYNIKFSRKTRPLARDKDSARVLFDERQRVYCLADWHFLVKPGSTSYDVALEIADQVL